MKKTALITGGSRGIGLAIAEKLAADGFNISILSLGEMENKPTDWLYFDGSIVNADDRQTCVEQTVAHFGGVHVLVNNAGVAPSTRADLLDMTEESFDRVVGINTKGTFFLSQLVANQMLKQEVCGAKRGTIINISSCSAVTVSVNRGEYCISKAGIAMTTQLFAARLADEGIFVHEIRPGIIATDMTSGVRGKYDDMIEQGVFPIRRWGKPQDVANAVAAFSGDTFLYTTGNAVDVDGGFAIRRL